MRKTELLIPAGSLDVLKTAVIYGADAVYLGGEAFGLRAKAKNFTNEEIMEGIKFAHDHGVKVYITANILAHNDDLAGVEEYFEELKTIRPDALIISDPGVFTIAKRVLPDMEIHISTQANNTNYGTYLFWHELGAKRVVSARELSLKEIKEIREHIPEDMEIESFIHGAMCISYSGRCLLSNFFTGRDANQGACTHPCRWKYSVVEETRPGEYMPVYENERGTYIFNSKDLCMIEHVPEMIDAGIDSFKIEGRMKSAYYLATVVSRYRMLIDYIYEHGHADVEIIERVKKEIAKAENRPTGPGFYNGLPGYKVQLYQDHDETVTQEYVAIVQDYDKESQMATLQVKNHFMPNQDLEIFGPHILSTIVHVDDVYDSEENVLEVCNKPMQIVHTKWSGPIEVDAMIRKIR
mgnify:CR=1 FL=1